MLEFGGIPYSNADLIGPKTIHFPTLIFVFCLEIKNADAPKLKTMMVWKDGKRVLVIVISVLFSAK
ncbi:hypothetical protein D3C73_982350 [compost metagenome]